MRIAARPEPIDLIEHKIEEIRRKLSALRAQEEMLAALLLDCERKCALEDGE